MRLVIQRVREAQVHVSGKTVGAIDHGLLILLGIADDDNEEDALWLIHKMLHMRIFNDEEGVMNRDLLEVAGGLLVISQFTLLAATKKGHRPSYIRAAKPEKAIPLYRFFIDQAQKLVPSKIAEGVFGAEMQVQLVNDGPVTITIDSRNRE